MAPAIVAALLLAARVADVTADDHAREYAYGMGPRVANMFLSQCSVWYGTLEEAKAMCNNETACQALHDHGCDGQHWRFCSITTSAMAATGGGSDACTMSRHFYQDGPRVDDGQTQRCSTWHGSLDDAIAMCSNDTACKALHDHGCDGQNWRFCSVTTSVMQAASSGTGACTMAKVAACTTTDGSGLSSDYPCACGGTTCTDGSDACDADSSTCTPAACSTTDGSTVSGVYPCACGSATCTDGNHICDAGSSTCTPGHAPLRLVGGSSELSGRLEVFFDGQWGTVCDDFWTAEWQQATVVCRQLGFLGGTAVRMAGFGQGTGQIWLDDVQCSGHESGLSDCWHNAWGVHNCQHREDVGVECQAPQPCTTTDASTFSSEYPCVCGSTTCAGGHEVCLAHSSTCAPGHAPVRLVGGSSALGGRLEVNFDGQWGTVCDDSFSAPDAQVVCRQLGFAGGAPVGSSVFGQGTGPIFLDDLRCAGSEGFLSDCPHLGWGRHNCGHHEDVGIQCTPVACTTTDGSGLSNDYPCACGGTTCTDGSDACDADSSTCTPRAAPVRLVGGSSPSSGRLEVYHQGQWGTVCNGSFGAADAQVVCRQLGFPPGGAEVGVGSFGQASAHVWLDQVACAGSESALSDCWHNGWGAHNCGQSEEVGIECQPIEPCTSADGSGLSSVYPCFCGNTTCDTGSDVCDAGSSTCALVACNTTDGSGVSSTYPCTCGSATCSGWNDICHAGFGACVPEYVYEDGPRVGNSQASQCEGNGWYGTLEDAKARCSRDADCRALHDYDCDGESWRTCSATASVMQASGGGAQACTMAKREPCTTTDGSGPSSAYPCTCGSATCATGNDACDAASSSCAPGPIPVRLAGNSSSTSGRLEVFYHGQWGTVCNRNFSDMDAQVVCRQLGFPGGVEVGGFGQGSGPIWLGGAACNGSESGLSDCGHGGWGEHDCGHWADAGIECAVPWVQTTPPSPSLSQSQSLWSPSSRQSQSQTTPPSPSLGPSPSPAAPAAPTAAPAAAASSSTPARERTDPAPPASTTAGASAMIMIGASGPAAPAEQVTSSRAASSRHIVAAFALTLAAGGALA